MLWKLGFLVKPNKALSKMEDGPPKPACRGRLQTAPSCRGKELWW